MIYSAFVMLEGIQVPVEYISTSFSLGGSEVVIGLAPSQTARKILPSTHVHIWQCDPAWRSYRRRAVGISDVRNRDTKLLLPEQSAETVGDQVSAKVGGDVDDYSLFRGTPMWAWQYLWGGEVVSSDMVRSPDGSPVAVLRCRGYPHLLDRISAIQLIGGPGTLTQEERRYFGQMRPVFSYRGQYGFSRGIRELTEFCRGNVALMSRQLATLYASQVNPMWRSRFNWARLLDQIETVDDDETASKLFGTGAFREYINNTFSSAYQLPLSVAIQQMLALARYTPLSVPSPAYFPFFGDAPARSSTNRSAVSRQAVGSSLGVQVEMPRVRFLADGDGQEFAPIRLEARIASSGAVAFPELPYFVEEISPQQEVYPNGDIQLDRTVPISQITRQLRPGQSCWFMATARLTLGVASISRPVRVQISRSRPSVRTTSVPASAPVVDEVRRDQWLSRLRNHLYLPYLWWACPPACNIIVLDDILSMTTSSSGMGAPTRTLTKIAPGLSGAGRTLLDKFVAPIEGQFLDAAEDVSVDPTNSDQLSLREYAQGITPDIEYFDTIARLVRSADWETYVRSYTNLRHYEKVLEGESAQIPIDYNPKLVPGPCLILANASSSNEEFAPSRSRARLQALRRLRGQLRRCLQRQGLDRKAVAVMRYLRSLAGIRISLTFQQDFYASPGAGTTPRLFPEAVRAVNGGGLQLGDLRVLRQSLLARDFGMQESTALTQLRERLVAELPTSASTAQDGVQVAPSPRWIDFTADDLVRLVGDEAARAIYPVNTVLQVPIPSVQRLTEWYRNVASLERGVAACREALSRDLQLLEDTLRREAGTSAASSSDGPTIYLGHIQNISSNVTGSSRQMSVLVTHLREVGESLELTDTTGGDDMESLVAFGENGFMDDRYSTPRIGEEVYQPLLGGPSLADVASSLSPEEGSEVLDRTQLFEELIPDVIEQLVHPSVCGHSCVEEVTGSSIANASDAARAFAQAYIRRRRESDPEDLKEWLQSVRNRVSMTFLDAYRGREVILLGREGEKIVSEIPLDAGKDMYDGDNTLHGFFSSSFLDSTGNPDRVRTPAFADRQGQVSYVGANDKELELFARRREAVLRFVEATTGGTSQE